jgi:chemotaxis protein methyltransferase CheR
LIEETCGIRTPPAKIGTLESRLRKRLADLDLDDFDDYCQLLDQDTTGEELVLLIDEVTTNKTDFFREAAHFDTLVKVAVPELAAAHGAGNRRDLKVWCAGCSTGEEPYTLAILLAEVAARTKGFRYQILATDICTEVLELAKGATYAAERIEPMAVPLRQKYLLRSRDGRPIVRIVPEIRDRVRFLRHNLADRDFSQLGTMDVFFCRNVFIYFKREVQGEILARFCRSLVPGGFLFLGHSETIFGLDLPLETVAPTVYRRLRT